MYRVNSNFQASVVTSKAEYLCIEWVHKLHLNIMPMAFIMEKMTVQSKVHRVSAAPTQIYATVNQFHLTVKSKPQKTISRIK